MYPHPMKSLHAGIALTAMHHQQVLMKANDRIIGVGGKKSRKRKRREAKIKFTTRNQVKY